MAVSMPTYYDVLQVERDASPAGVRAAYRRLAHRYHPDKMPGHANAGRAMAAINAAYEVLSDPQRRAEHDLWLRRAERPPQPLPQAPEWPRDLRSFLHPSFSWPWYLLFGTVAVTLGTIGAAVYLGSMPARAASAPTPTPCQVAKPATGTLAGCTSRSRF